jgi:hypothetical protein
MSLSEKAVSNGISLAHSHRASAGFAFPLVLVCVALALVLASALFSPVTLDVPGAAESFLIGP